MCTRQNQPNSLDICNVDRVPDRRERRDTNDDERNELLFRAQVVDTTATVCRDGRRRAAMEKRAISWCRKTISRRVLCVWLLARGVGRMEGRVRKTAHILCGGTEGSGQLESFCNGKREFECRVERNFSLLRLLPQ